MLAIFVLAGPPIGFVAFWLMKSSTASWLNDITLSSAAMDTIVVLKQYTYLGIAAVTYAVGLLPSTLTALAVVGASFLTRRRSLLLPFSAAAGAISSAMLIGLFDGVGPSGLVVAATGAVTGMSCTTLCASSWLSRSDSHRANLLSRDNAIRAILLYTVATFGLLALPVLFAMYLPVMVLLIIGDMFLLRNAGVDKTLTSLSVAVLTIAGIAWFTSGRHR